MPYGYNSPSYAKVYFSVGSTKRMEGFSSLHPCFVSVLETCAAAFSPLRQKLGTLRRKSPAIDEKSGIFVLRPARMTDKGACPNVNREGLDVNRESHDANREGTAANRKRNAATPRTAETQTAPRRVDEERSEQAGDESRRSAARFSAVPPSVFRAAGGARRTLRVPCPLWGRNATKHC